MQTKQNGPCIVCGATNYNLSCGGPSICPKCDCGMFDNSTVEQQAKIIHQLRSALKPFVEADWYSYGNGAFQGIIPGDALDTAKALVPKNSPQ